ncbi:MAG TPA: Xaa-Pro peptidase family protein [Acidimicrobiales bacterium]|nr:Xaa-Pro peptidase family protein [Acidimicrobiales bacterium]
MIPLEWPDGARIGGRPLPVVPDLARLRAERGSRLRSLMEVNGVDCLLLLATGNVAYATGATAPAADAGRAALFRNVAVVVRTDPYPHVFTPVPEGAPPELPSDHVHPPLYPDLAEGMGALASALAELVGPGTVIGVDEQTHPMLARLDGFEWIDAGAVLGAAKICKTPDEVACIRAAQRINELAMADVQAALRPGLRQTDLSAVLLRRLFELGATSNCIDPIWQVMEPSKELGPWTVHGDLAFPTPTTDRFLRAGDVIWNDSGISFEGYASDFGRTWVVGSSRHVEATKRAQFRRWRDVVDAVLAVLKPGCTALAMDRAAIEANGGSKPWIEHFYLAHGVGTESAEMPLVGTDLGEAFDESLEMAPGMVLVLEPVIWEEGAAGYRAEDIVVVTDDGWAPMSDYPYDPYELAP